MNLTGVLRLLVPSVKGLRLSAYLLVIGVISFTLSSRMLYARVQEAALSFGSGLVGLADLTQGEEAIHINGEQFHYSMTVMSEPVSKVLDRVEQFCGTSPGLFGQLSRETAAQRAYKPMRWPFRNGVIRDEADDRGMVVCFMGNRIGGLSPMVGSLERLATTASLAVVGRLRYSFAEQRKDGRTRVVTVWTDTGLDLSKMFPNAGDAEGSDSSILPRPPQSQRLLSATAGRATSSLRMYHSDVGKAQLQSYYEEWMSKHDWQVAATSEASGTVAYINKDGYQAIVTVLNEKSDSYVTLTETGSADEQVLVSGN